MQTFFVWFEVADPAPQDYTWRPKDRKPDVVVESDTAKGAADLAATSAVAKGNRKPGQFSMIVAAVSGRYRATVTTQINTTVEAV